MKRMVAGLVAMILTACSGMADADSPETEPSDRAENSIRQPDPTQTQPVLENLGPAPELENDVWLNTDAPLRLVDLRGRVVLLDMWTFG